MDVNPVEMILDIVSKGHTVGEMLFDAGFSEQEITYFVITWMAAIYAKDPKRTQ